MRHIPYVEGKKEIERIIEIVLDTTIQEWRTDLYFDQSRYNTTLADIWKAAADKTLAKEELIQRLLAILGHFLDVSRASYFEAAEDGKDAECKVQWCNTGITSYLGEKIPVAVCRAVNENITADFACLTRENLPEKARGPLLEYFERHRIKSLFIIPFDRKHISFFSFADCQLERGWKETETALILEMIKIVSIRIDQIKTEDEKSILESQLRHAQTLEAIGQLAGGIAHDFNNSLGAISGYAEMIRQKFSAQNPKLEKYASAILSGARRAAELTSQLLAFARKGRYQKTIIDLHQMVSHISLLLQHSLEQKIRLVLDLKAENPFILGDPTQMQNALLNLAMNARDAMPEGGTLTFGTENCGLDPLLLKSHPDAMVGPYIAVSVIDTGVGMDERTKEKLFEPFFTTKDIGKGTGLGLASVYGSVKSHNGYIAVHSEIGRGSAIIVYLPVEKDALLRRRGAAAQEIVPGSGNIVVIDNDEAIRIICREMLAAMGYSVRVFENGRDAIEHYRTNAGSVDLVIIDMIMEGLNGRTCYRELKKINPGVKAILSSGYSLDGDLQDILHEGICGVLQKPFDSARLSHVVADALKGAGSGETSAP